MVLLIPKCFNIHMLKKLQLRSMDKSKFVIIMAVVGILGSIYLFKAHAATTALELEPEKGSATSEIAGGNDSQASGGAYIKFTSGQASPGKLDTHNVIVDGSGKIVSWVTPQDTAYAKVSKLAWDYLKALPNANDCGKPAYYCHSYMNPSVSPSEPVGWPHNPAGLYGMLIESAVDYYQYSGDTAVLNIAKDVADQQLATGMTKSTDNWANAPYSSGDAGSLTYNGASYGDSNGAGDGKGIMQPDKIGEFGVGLVQLYKLTGDQKYLTAAINGANTLVSHVRTGSANQSPWPYRVVAATGAIKEQYSAHVISPIELFDELIALNAGDTAGYQTTRTTAWNWMMNFPMKNNVWTQYFEDVPIQSNYAENLNQLNAMMTARYMLENPDKDSQWETHVRALIKWNEDKFGQQQYGATIIREQMAFAYPMGSHTSRYASVNAMLYEKTGDTAAKEKAYRSFNWATYMARSNGVVLDGPAVGNQWFTDGYGDFVRHFMKGMAAVPEWAPSGEKHLLRSTSIVKSITYGASSINYLTYGASSTETLRSNTKPTSVTAGGSALNETSSGTGWTYSDTTGVLKINHANSGDIKINY